MAWKAPIGRERDGERRAARTPEQIEHDRKQDCEKARRYRERHRDALKEKRHTEVHRAKSRAISTRYRKKHLRPADYELKLASQNNLCALCGKPFDVLCPWHEALLRPQPYSRRDNSARDAHS